MLVSHQTSIIWWNVSLRILYTLTDSDSLGAYSLITRPYNVFNAHKIGKCRSMCDVMILAYIYSTVGMVWQSIPHNQQQPLPCTLIPSLAVASKFFLLSIVQVQVCVDRLFKPWQKYKINEDFLIMYTETRKVEFKAEDTMQVWPNSLYCK